MINENVKRVGIIGGLIICTILAFVIRLAPINYLGGSGDMLGAPDSWYNLRLVEYMVQNGKMLNFDPMTAYDTGAIVNWGVIFTALSSLLSLISGAISRVEIIDAVSWLSPILSSLCVIILFFIGKKLGNWKTGLLSALFMAVIGGQYFSRSIYGLFDHHVAEVFFSCLFCLCYIIALKYSQDANFKSIKTLKLPIFLGCIVGLSYLCGLLTMTTLLIFGLFAMIFTTVQFVINYHKEKSSDYLLLINGLMFLIATIGLLIYGIKLFNFELTGYSSGLIFVQLLAIVSLLILYGLTKVKRLRNMKYHPTIMYVGALVSITVVACIVCAIVNYDLFNMVVYNIGHQFTPTYGGMTTVREASPWSFNSAWSSFNIGLLLAGCGFAFVCYDAIKKHDVLCHFVIWWTIGTFVFACAQIRWEYYFAPLVVLLSAIFVEGAITYLIDGIKKFKIYFKEKKEQKTSKKKKIILKRPNEFPIVLACIVILFGCLFVGISIGNDVYLSEAYGASGGTSPDWVDACEWLKTNTADIGVEPYGTYDNDTFLYPDESYGVVAWWDFGHYISVIGERLPVANPFQMNVELVAEILMATDEDTACKLMDELNCKYIMVDYNTGNNFIPVMAVWLDRNLVSQKDVYDTMAFRLYNLEGKGSESYNIPALEHFKLVYTSPNVIYGYDTNGKIVEQTTKIFEYV